MCVVETKTRKNIVVKMFKTNNFLNVSSSLYVVWAPLSLASLYVSLKGRKKKKTFSLTEFSFYDFQFHSNISQSEFCCIRCLSDLTLLYLTNYELNSQISTLIHQNYRAKQMISPMNERSELFMLRLMLDCYAKKKKE